MSVVDAVPALNCFSSCVCMYACQPTFQTMFEFFHIIYNALFIDDYDEPFHIN